MVEDMPPKPLILVVDDEPGNVGFLNEILSAEYQVRVALDGESALRMAEGEIKPDLILLDIIMPGIDGLEVCRRLKSNWATRDIPIIFVTVRGEESDELTGLRLGAVDYIAKPYSAPIVQARVRTHLVLKQARERLERQNEELREAAHLREAMEQITRHDLKSPLQAILGNLDLMGEQELTEQQVRRLEAMRRACYRILGLINLSLDTYKIESGSYPFKPRDFDLVVLVGAILQDMRSLPRDHEVSFTVTLDGDPIGPGQRCPVIGEELLCFSMLGNLIKNAVEATPPGSRVEIALWRDPDRVRVDIHNPGVVSPEVRDKFFAKYVTHGKPGGTGLGTYSAWLIARLHEGEVTMQTSPEDSRTTVSVTWPLIKQK